MAMDKLQNYIDQRSNQSPVFKKQFDEASKRLDVAVAVRNLRESLSMTQREFAEYVGKPQSTIGRIETGKMNVSLDILNEIAEATETTLEIRYVKKGTKTGA